MALERKVIVVTKAVLADFAPAKIVVAEIWIVAQELAGEINRVVGFFGGSGSVGLLDSRETFEQRDYERKAEANQNQTNSDRTYMMHSFH